MTQNKMLQIQKSHVEKHLKLLDLYTEKFLFAAFHDDQDLKAKPVIRHGALNEHFEELTELNQAGYGIFVTINETQGPSRKLEDIMSYRAVWVENDTSIANSYPLQPSFRVQTSPGKYHDYFKTSGLDYFQRIALQQRLVTDFNSDQNAADAARVLRLVGFYHQKKSLKKGLVGEPYLVCFDDSVQNYKEENQYQAGELMAAFHLPTKLAGLIKHNSKVEYEYKNIVTDMLSLKSNLMEPDAQPVTNETINIVNRVLSIVRIGDEHYHQELPVNGIEVVRSTLLMLKAQKYQSGMQANALEVLEQIESDFKKLCSDNANIQKMDNTNLDHKYSKQELREVQIALSLIESDERDGWIKVGHALKNDFADTGFELWDEWSQTSDKYDPERIRYDWNSFNPKDITRSSIFYMAQQNLNVMIKQAQKDGLL